MKKLIGVVALSALLITECKPKPFTDIANQSDNGSETKSVSDKNKDGYILGIKRNQTSTPEKIEGFEIIGYDFYVCSKASGGKTCDKIFKPFKEKLALTKSIEEALGKQLWEDKAEPALINITTSGGNAEKSIDLRMRLKGTRALNDKISQEQSTDSMIKMASGCLVTSFTGLLTAGKKYHLIIPSKSGFYEVASYLGVCTLGAGVGILVASASEENQQIELIAEKYLKYLFTTDKDKVLEGISTLEIGKVLSKSFERDFNEDSPLVKQWLASE